MEDDTPPPLPRTGQVDPVWREARDLGVVNQYGSNMEPTWDQPYLRDTMQGTLEATSYPADFRETLSSREQTAVYGDIDYDDSTFYGNMFEIGSPPDGDVARCFLNTPDCRCALVLLDAYNNEPNTGKVSFDPFEADLEGPPSRRPPGYACRGRQARRHIHVQASTIRQFPTPVIYPQGMPERVPNDEDEEALQLPWPISGRGGYAGESFEDEPPAPEFTGDHLEGYDDPLWDELYELGSEEQWGTQFDPFSEDDPIEDDPDWKAAQDLGASNQYGSNRNLQRDDRQETELVCFSNTGDRVGPSSEYECEIHGPDSPPRGLNPNPIPVIEVVSQEHDGVQLRPPRPGNTVCEPEGETSDAIRRSVEIYNRIQRAMNSSPESRPRQMDETSAPEIEDMHIDVGEPVEDNWAPMPGDILILRSCRYEIPWPGFDGKLEIYTDEPNERNAFVGRRVPSCAFETGDVVIRFGTYDRRWRFNQSTQVRVFQYRKDQMFLVARQISQTLYACDYRFTDPRAKGLHRVDHRFDPRRGDLIINRGVHFPFVWYVYWWDDGMPVRPSDLLVRAGYGENNTLSYADSYLYLRNPHDENWIFLGKDDYCFFKT
ncbi:hypothetical protein MPTK1_4g00820 [Marchantia polymorpha subsp. ruderalis]|uniref:Uncharacterized protein n=1 Tax=Marchantia polymorpha subsp. ruderalis TaxID=1480154 RepID=A0AAF6B4Z6_MARPO|nr:hypothetical protein Mp_4g00820 [Marchantia polymorpha subsp. ruderalis]